MAGIPTVSPRVLRESLGSSHSRLTSAEDNEEALAFGLSARRSVGREEYIPCQKERQSLTDRERRRLRSPWSKRRRRQGGPWAGGRCGCPKQRGTEEGAW